MPNRIAKLLMEEEDDAGEIKTDISMLEDSDLRILQHYYSDIMGDPDLLIRYIAAKGGHFSLTRIYAGCKVAIGLLEKEIKKREDKLLRTKGR